MAEADIWPTHAYVPGKTPRHKEGAFDSIRETAQEGLSPDELAECAAFRIGLRYLDAGFYWEAHELFEPVWMVLPDPGHERQFVQGLIQLANGYLKIRMERPKAAARLAHIARALVTDKVHGTVMGVDRRKIAEMIDSLERSLNDEI